jgi:hypothetical protein
MESLPKIYFYRIGKTLYLIRENPIMREANSQLSRIRSTFMIKKRGDCSPNVHLKVDNPSLG